MVAGLEIAFRDSLLIGDTGVLIELFTLVTSETKDVYLLYSQSIKRPERVNLVISSLKLLFEETSQ